MMRYDILKSDLRLVIKTKKMLMVSSCCALWWFFLSVITSVTVGILYASKPSKTHVCNLEPTVSNIYECRVHYEDLVQKASSQVSNYLMMKSTDIHVSFATGDEKTMVLHVGISGATGVLFKNYPLTVSYQADFLTVIRHNYPQFHNLPFKEERDFIESSSQFSHTPVGTRIVVLIMNSYHTKFVLSEIKNETILIASSADIRNVRMSTYTTVVREVFLDQYTSNKEIILSYVAAFPDSGVSLDLSGTTSMMIIANKCTVVKGSGRILITLSDSVAIEYFNAGHNDLIMHTNETFDLSKWYTRNVGIVFNVNTTQEFHVMVIDSYISESSNYPKRMFLGGPDRGIIHDLLSSGPCHMHVDWNTNMVGSPLSPPSPPSPPLSPNFPPVFSSCANITLGDDVAVYPNYDQDSICGETYRMMSFNTFNIITENNTSQIVFLNVSDKTHLKMGYLSFNNFNNSYLRNVSVDANNIAHFEIEKDRCVDFSVSLEGDSEDVEYYITIHDFRARSYSPNDCESPDSRTCGRIGVVVRNSLFAFYSKTDTYSKTETYSEGWAFMPKHVPVNGGDEHYITFYMRHSFYIRMCALGEYRDIMLSLENGVAPDCSIGICS